MAESDVPADKEREEVILAGQEGRTDARTDFVASLLLMGIGAAAFAAAYQMPGFEHWGSYARPGFPPMFFSAMLALGAAVLFLRSVREKGHRLGITKAGIRRFATAPATSRFIAILILVAGFFVLLTVRQIHFAIKATAFLFCAMLYYKGGGWRMCLAVAAATAALVWFIFYTLFGVPLP